MSNDSTIGLMDRLVTTNGGDFQDIFSAGVHEATIRQIDLVYDDEYLDHTNRDENNQATITPKKDFQRDWLDRAQRVAAVFSDGKYEFTNYFNLIGYVRMSEVSETPALLENTMVKTLFKAAHGFDLDVSIDNFDTEIISASTEGGSEDYATYKGHRLIDPERIIGSINIFSGLTKVCGIPTAVKITDAVESLKEFEGKFDLVLADEKLSPTEAAKKKRATNVVYKYVAPVGTAKDRKTEKVEAAADGVY